MTVSSDGGLKGNNMMTMKYSDEISEVKSFTDYLGKLLETAYPRLKCEFRQVAVDMTQLDLTTVVSVIRVSWMIDSVTDLWLNDIQILWMDVINIGFRMHNYGFIVKTINSMILNKTGDMIR